MINMSYLSVAVRLWHTLVIVLRLAHRMCHTIDRINTRIQASNASGALKTASANLHTATHAFCDLVQAEKNGPGEVL